MEPLPMGRQADDSYQDMGHNSSSYEIWKNFFHSAGIPSAMVHDYAVTFSQHRIKIDMLRDINKDILHEMGIKAMGDIIAILRRAKQLCAQQELKNGSLPTLVSSSAQAAASIQSQAQASSRTNSRGPPRQPPIRDTTSHKTPSSSSSSTTTTVPTRKILALDARLAPPAGKIQSRLNLNSGAIIAASSNLTHSNSRLDPNNKRPVSGVSGSMAKRLRPGPAREPPRVTEKTLTVHYPSNSALARVHQRISAKRQQSGSSKSTVFSRLK